MKQYCRYCCFLCTGNGIYCGELQKEIPESVAKAQNRCSNFAYNPIDAFMSVDNNGEVHQYKPREPKKEQCDGQISLLN